MKSEIKETVLISGIEFSEGVVIVISDGSKAKVTRITSKSIFILKDGDIEPKMVVNKLVESYLEKKTWVIENPVAGKIEEKAVKAPKLPKAEKAPKVEKVKEEKAPKEIKEKVFSLRSLSNSVKIHYLISKGFSVKEILLKDESFKKGHISGCMNDCKNNPKKMEESVVVYLAHNALTPELAPLVEMVVRTEPAPVAKPKAEAKKEETPVAETPETF